MNHNSSATPAFSESDHHWMKKALMLAREASDRGEVPVGAVVVMNERLIGTGHNLRESRQDPILHAEVVAIQEAAKELGAWRLQGATMYVTLEPCVMCSGALIHARIDRLVVGALDPKTGACGSLFKLHEDSRFNHQFLVQHGLLADESAQLLREFFKARRR